MLIVIGFILFGFCLVGFKFFERLIGLIVVSIFVAYLIFNYFIKI
jgi:hypothetical protein